MSQPVTEIRFDDGAAYERGMGVWSRLAGDVFLDWLAPAGGLRWLDVGCGSGAFSEAVLQRFSPSDVQGVDPSEAQLAFARARSPAATFQLGDAMALPFADNRFDAAVMALVIFFVPDPAKGVAEMARVVRPGGMVAAYAWDFTGGGFPFQPIQQALRSIGVPPLRPPSAGAERIEILRALWEGAGLTEIETCEITVHRGFADFEALWTASTGTGGMRQIVASLSDAQRTVLRDGLRAQLPPHPDGRIRYPARANAIKGRVPN
ncbi:class I SAM-dependent methyltransferase [Rhodopila sp.]|uniref:class I SAM-dependent methyltransferase n=1 Tax=Rhodopila sp. TaxID=2480087 RepID=UPI002CE033F0|nr:class I SAM-dependent methyltransferase [Rhodopila sp.]HVZ09257.1 class I SAM-dependent methyltransferase [Rhodopila sp.]